MEVAMTRTAVRHTLSALAALALVSAFASNPTSAGELSNTERELVDSLQSMNRGLDKPTFGEKFKMGLATQKPPQQTPTTHYEFRWWQDYGN
jgi:hypothetical protein